MGLSLLLHGYVNRIVLNDLSEPIYAFWHAMLDCPERFKARIYSVDLTPQEWEVQRGIFRDEAADRFDLGFAAFFLNRTNHSGVLNGGMIGGQSQKSFYGLDARFNRNELAARVERIVRHRSRISISGLSAEEFLADLNASCGDLSPLLYIDPPYFKKGRDLYYDFYREDDHGKLCEAVTALPETANWIVTYDDVPPIRELYGDYCSESYSLSYSVRNGRIGREVMFFSSNLTAVPLVEGGLEAAETVSMNRGSAEARIQAEPVEEIY